MTHRICNKCDTVKTLDLFYVARNKYKGRDYVTLQCKSCTNLRTAKIKKTYPSGRYKLSRRESSLKIRYGLTLQKFSLMKSNQSNKCKICSITFNESPRKMDSVVVDHCHSTNRVRGLLCAACNLMLGYVRDKSPILKSAIQYLKEYA